MPAPPENLKGRIFGRLKVISITEERDNCRSIVWKCRCSCKDKNIVKVAARTLKSGDSRSCGCLHKESARNQGLKNKKHGATKRVSKKGDCQLDYIVWQGIKQRCFYKKHKRYADYGGRGITMHKAWRKDFRLFAAYIRTLPNCPSEKILKSRQKGRRLNKSIDRINNNGNYTPGNLKWSTALEQSNNTRRNIIVEYKGRSMTLSQAIRDYSVIPYKTVYHRLVKNWPIEEALLTPSRRQRP